MKPFICTLAVGEEKVEECQRLIYSCRKYTDYDVCVYTDDVDAFDCEYVYDLSQVTKVDLYHRVNTFNYNLKGIITCHCYKMFKKYNKIIYMDCDVTFHKSNDLFNENFNMADVYGSYGYFGKDHRVVQTGLKFDILKDKLKLEDFFEDMIYMNEVIFICNRSDNTNKFLKRWSELCTFSSTHDINPCQECVELGVALYQTPDLIVANLNGSVLKHNNIITTRHRNKELDLIRK